MKTIKTLTVIVAIVALFFNLSACDTEKNNTENNTTSYSNTYSENYNTTEPVSSAYSNLVDNILTHIDEWEYICDDFTKNYTYDKIETVSLWLYSTNTQGEYYFCAGSLMPTDIGGAIIYQKIFLVTEDAFEYMYSSVYSIEDDIVKNCKLLAANNPEKGSEKKEYINQLVSEGLDNETKYFQEINLSDKETFELSEEQATLFNNMHTAIKEIEQNIKLNSEDYFVEIEYYYLGNGECEMLLIPKIRYPKGYYVYQDGYEQLSDSGVERLRNTSTTINLNWNFEWTEDKKEYMLKESIYKNCQ